MLYLNTQYPLVIPRSFDFLSETPKLILRCLVRPRCNFPAAAPALTPHPPPSNHTGLLSGSGTCQLSTDLGPLHMLFPPEIDFSPAWPAMNSAHSLGVCLNVTTQGNLPWPLYLYRFSHPTIFYLNTYLFCWQHFKFKNIFKIPLPLHGKHPEDKDLFWVQHIIGAQ